MKIDRPTYKDWTLRYDQQTFGIKLSTEMFDPKRGVCAVAIQPKYDGRWCTLFHAQGDDTIYAYSRTGNLQASYVNERFCEVAPFEMYGEYIFGTHYAKTSPLEGYVLLFDMRSDEPFVERMLSMRVIVSFLQHVDATLPLRVIASEYIKAKDSVTFASKSRAVIDHILEKGDRDGQPVEGVVLRPLYSLFGVGWVRIKPIFTLDYVVMGFNQSDAPKYKGHMVKSVIAGLYDKEGVLHEVCHVSGLSDYQRMKFYDTPEAYVGRVMECSGKGVFPSGALRHPNFVRFRNDKLPSDCVMPNI